MDAAFTKQPLMLEEILTIDSKLNLVNAQQKSNEKFMLN